MVLSCTGKKSEQIQREYQKWCLFINITGKEYITHQEKMTGKSSIIARNPTIAFTALCFKTQLKSGKKLVF